MSRCAAYLPFLLPALLHAQVITTVVGTVSDPSGATIPGATVTLRATGQPTPAIAQPATTAVQSDSSGTFRLSAPTPGSYTLTITAPGFDAFTTSVHLTPSTHPTLQITLPISAQTQQVQVEDTAASAVQPSATQLGSTFDRQQLAAVPLNGRSFTDLLAFTPGVVPVPSAQPNAVVMSGVASTPPSGNLDIGALSVSGQRETANAFHVNGSNVQEDVNMGVTVVPTLDSIASLEVLTSSFDARLGNQSGGQIAVETRSGTPIFHGSVFDYFRNTALDARNYFSLTRAPFHQNQFGATLGGPAPHLHDLFFFVDYQGTRQAQGIDTGIISVPSVADRSGNLADQLALLTGTVSGPYLAQQLTASLGQPVSAGEPYAKVFPTGLIPQSAISAPAQHLLQSIPQPNVGTSSFSTSTYAQSVRDDKGSLRLDRNTRVGALSAYYSLDDYTLVNPYPTGQGGATVPGFNAENDGRAQLYALNLTSTFGASATNHAHLSYMRNAANVGQPLGGVGPSLASQGFVTGSDTSGINPQLPKIQGIANVVFNELTFGVDVTSLFQAENIFEASDDYSRIFRTHILSFGATVHGDQINTHPAVYDNGSFSFTGSETGSDFADFLLGVDSSYTQGQGQNFYNRNHYLGLYAQDSWRAAPQITLNYGLRWDVLPPWSEKDNQLLTLYPSPGAKEQSVVYPNAPAGILFPGDPGVPRTLSPTRYSGFAPRIAASWSPQADSPLVAHLLGSPGNTLIKLGYGLYYSAFEGLSAGIMSGNPPYGFTDTSAAPTLFSQPFITAATGVSVGQRFPLQHVAFGASRAHPNTSVDWSNFEPLTGIAAFATNNSTPYSQNYSLSIQRQLSSHTFASIGFVGTQAHHLLAIQEVNPGNPAACLALSTASAVAPNSATCGPFGESSTYTTATGTLVNGTRSNFSSNFGSVNLQRTIANAHDNALEASFNHSSRTLFLDLSYTWSRSIDQSSGLPEAIYPDVPGYSSAGLSRALSSFDLTHNFVATYRYTLPVQQLLSNHPRLNHPRLNQGWQLSGITRFSTGFPVTLVNNNDTSLLGTQPNGINNNGVDEPAFTPGNLQTHHTPQSSGAPAFATSLFSLPTLGTLGNARRRFFYGPGAENTDLAIDKSTPIAGRLSEPLSLEVRAEAFNVFNHSQFFGPAAVNGNLSSANFGQIENSASPRLLQISTRLSF